MPGWLTNGATVLTTPNQLKTGLIEIDTGNANGASPQVAAVSPAVLGTITQALVAQIALVALAGGAKAGATPLAYGANNIATVTTAADSVLLPFAFPGALVFVRNAAANATQVFGAGTDTINGVATATGVSQAGTTGVWYVGISGNGDGTNAGAWVRT